MPSGRKPGPLAYEDRVQHDFTADAANQLRMTDISKQLNAEGTSHFCAVKDVFFNRIVVHFISDCMKARLVDALHSAVARRSVEAPTRRTV